MGTFGWGKRLQPEQPEVPDWRIRLLEEHERLQRMIRERIRKTGESREDAMDAVIYEYLGPDWRVH